MHEQKSAFGGETADSGEEHEKAEKLFFHSRNRSNKGECRLVTRSNPTGDQQWFERGSIQAAWEQLLNKESTELSYHGGQRNLLGRFLELLCRIRIQFNARAATTTRRKSDPSTSRFSPKNKPQDGQPTGDGLGPNELRACLVNRPAHRQALRVKREKALGRRCPRRHGPLARLRLGRLGREPFLAHAGPAYLPNTS